MPCNQWRCLTQCGCKWKSSKIAEPISKSCKEEKDRMLKSFLFIYFLIIFLNNITIYSSTWHQLKLLYSLKVNSAHKSYTPVYILYIHYNIFWMQHYQNNVSLMSEIKQDYTYAIEMTIKSSQFQGSLRKVKPSIQKPRATIFVSDSKV